MSDGLIRARLVVRALWDADAGVWVASSEDIPGLVVEHADLDTVMEIIQDVTPDLLRANGAGDRSGLPINLLADRAANHGKTSA
jgi:hypothetical protein